MADAEAKRISVQDARAKLQSDDSFLLVCIYPKEKHLQSNLEGSTGIGEFESKVSSLDKTTSIAFY